MVIVTNGRDKDGNIDIVIVKKVQTKPTVAQGGDATGHLMAEHRTMACC